MQARHIDERYLGHILGLEHEHQRQRAFGEIDFRCDQMPGYKEVGEKLKEANKRNAMEDSGLWTWFAKTMHLAG
jgi:hypothetical protein